MPEAHLKMLRLKMPTCSKRQFAYEINISTNFDVIESRFDSANHLMRRSLNVMKSVDHPFGCLPDERVVLAWRGTLTARDAVLDVSLNVPTVAHHPPGGDEWRHEVKFDGFRVQLHVEDGQALISMICGLSRVVLTAVLSRM